MDRKVLGTKLKTLFQKAKKPFLVLLALGSVGLGGRWLVSHGSHWMTEKMSAGLVGNIKHAVVSVQDKAEELHRADSENQRLRVENLNLRRWIEQVQFDCRSEEAKRQTASQQDRLKTLTGTNVGRLLAGIDYRPPSHLLPEQVYTLGVSYFRAHEYEKSAVIMTYLTGMEDNEQFKRPQAFLLAGISWYRLDHLELADQFLERVLSGDSKEKSQAPYFAQARLWRALVSHRLKDTKKTQTWLRDLLDHHPHSLESAWVNGQEVARLPASAPEVAEQVEPEHSDGSHAESQKNHEPEKEHGRSDDHNQH